MTSAMNSSEVGSGFRMTSNSSTTCPIHDVGWHGRMSFGRSQSIDNGYLRPEGYTLGRRGLFQGELSSDGILDRGRNPFKHSHSVGCAEVKASSQIGQHAKSVCNLTVPTRPRPNVLELCPNHNTSFNAYRRRYSRSSERSFDFDDIYLSDFGSTFHHPRYSKRSSSKDSGRSFSVVSHRQDDGGHGRWSNIRKGLSVLSLCTGNDDDDDDADDDRYYRRSKILRPPTRHFHHRGISGLPVKCPAKYMGLAY